MPTPLTFLGHASFRVDSPGGKRIYIDPWLTGNPKCPESELEPERVDLIALTHGHGDHLGDTIPLYNKFKCPVIALVELLGVKRCVPCHYGTFPLLTGSPEELAKLAPGVELITPEPGETVEL